MDQTKSQRKQPRQFTRDDVARFCASAVNAVLEKLSLEHIVLVGIAVYPAGEDVFLIDMVITDRVTKNTQAVLLTIPPVKEHNDEHD